MASRETTAAADAVGELVEYDTHGTTFSGGAVAGEVMLEGGSKSQLRGEVEDGLVDGIEDVLSGELEHEEIVGRLSSGSDEVSTCVKVDVLGEFGESHMWASRRTSLAVPIPAKHINGVSTSSLLTRRAEAGTHKTCPQKATSQMCHHV
jgi:hypothetical protein